MVFEKIKYIVVDRSDLGGPAGRADGEAGTGGGEAKEKADTGVSLRWEQVWG